DNGIGLGYSWEKDDDANTGDSAMFVRYESQTDIAQDWLISPAITITAGTPALSFFQHQAYTSDYGSVYTVRISTTTQTDTANFVIVDTQSESDFGLTYTSKDVDLS